MAHSQFFKKLLPNIFPSPREWIELKSEPELKINFSLVYWLT